MYGDGVVVDERMVLPCLLRAREIGITAISVRSLAAPHLARSSSSAAPVPQINVDYSVIQLGSAGPLPQVQGGTCAWQTDNEDGLARIVRDTDLGRRCPENMSNRVAYALFMCVRYADQRCETEEDATRLQRAVMNMIGAIKDACTVWQM